MNEKLFHFGKKEGKKISVYEKNCTEGERKFMGFIQYTRMIMQ